MKRKIVTVSSKYQIAIPKALLDRWGLQPGNTVKLSVERGILRVQPVKPVAKQPRRA